MTKQTIKLFVVAVLMLLPCVVYALPGAHDPVTGASGFSCNSCHTAGYTIGNRDATYATNICTKCHTNGNGTTKKQFNTADFANPYGTTVISQSSPVQSSHKWFGPENVPAAGAQAPVDTRANGLNKTGYPGNLACNRCHSVHGNSGDQSVVSPFLRMANDSDQMCRNCHAPRDHNDHTLGTHPVNVSYSTAYKANPTKLLQNPVANVSNPTAQVKIKNGLVVCSTCHGIHTSDSRSSTFDSYTTSTGFINLSSSKGYLLRVDARGKTANALNICTNCHTSKVAHNKVGQNVQCNDCHGGHVEYDATANAGDTSNIPNVYLVRRYLTYSTAGRISKRIIYNDAVNKKYYIAGGGGVCQSCHAVPQATHFTAGVLTRTNCAGCHNHNEAVGSFSPGAGSCDSCHGYPPPAPASGYTGNETTSPHVSHVSGTANYSYGCNQCHNGGEGTGPTHNNGSFNDGEFITKVAVTPGGVIAGPNAAYNGTQCSNVYCHSDGNGTYKTIAWAGGKGSLLGVGGTTECTACHANTAIATGAHAKHVNTTTGKGIGCATCHAATVSDNTTVSNKANHVNGTKDFTCATSACHSNGYSDAALVTPDWATPWTGDNCVKCHGSYGNQTYRNAGSTASHSKHLAQATFNANTKCNVCHTAYVSELDSAHVNGTLSPTSGCSNCHADPYNVAAPAAPTWGTSLTGCDACHSAHSITANGPATGSHNKHMTSTITASVCTDCHASGTTATAAPSVGHTDGDIDVIGTKNTGGTTNITKHSTASTLTCSTATCHADPYGTGLVATPVWGVTSGCAACHTGANVITANGPATGAHVKHMSSTMMTSVCIDCHAAGTTATAAPTFANGHIDGNIDVIGSKNTGGTSNITKHSTASTLTCSTASCHADPYSSGVVTTPSWSATSGCAACHTGANVITANGPATGSHNKHMTSTMITSVCADCHAAGTTATVAPTSANGHLDGNIDVIGAKNTGGTTNITKHSTASTLTCSTASCHADPYSTGAVTTPVWGVTSGCAACHTGANVITANGPATGAHSKHMTATGVACTDCHATGTTATAAPTPANGHTDGNVDVIGTKNTGGTTNITKHSTASTLTCATATCHGTIKAATPAWGAAASGNNSCTICHGTGTVTVTASNYEVIAPSDATATDTGKVSTTNNKTGAHQTHLKYLNGLSSQGADPQARCLICHPTPATTNHADGTSAPVFTGLAKKDGTAFSASYTGTGGTCNVYCHNPAGTGGTLSNAGTTTTPTWTNAALIADGTLKTRNNCNTCHKVPGDATFSFGSVHTSAGVTDTTTAAANNCTTCHGHEGSGGSHMDGVRDVTGGGGCNGCHGYNANEWNATWYSTNGKTIKNTGGIGAHATHITYLTTKRATITLDPATNLYAGSTTAWTNVCGICHGNTLSNHMANGVNVTLDQTYLFGTSGSATYNGAPGGPVASKTCSNLSCHYFTSPQWSN